MIDFTAKLFDLSPKEAADIKTADQLNLPTPDVEYHNIVAQPTEHQQEIDVYKRQEQRSARSTSWCCGRSALPSEMQSAKPTKKGANKMNNPMTYIQNLSLIHI